MQVTFKLLRHDMKLDSSSGCWLNGLFFLALFGFFVFLDQFRLSATAMQAIILLTVVTLIFLNRKVFYKWAGSRNVIGTLVFDETGVTVTEQNVSTRLAYSDLSSMDLVFNYFQGYQMEPRGIVHDGLSSVLFTSKTGKEYKFKFRICEEQEMNGFKLILKAIYKQKITVKEKLEAGSKTILLEPNVPYAKIQALKKELGVDSFNGH